MTSALRLEMFGGFQGLINLGEGNYHLKALQVCDASPGLIGERILLEDHLGDLARVLHIDSEKAVIIAFHRGGAGDLVPAPSFDVLKIAEVFNLTGDWIIEGVDARVARPCVAADGFLS